MTPRCGAWRFSGYGLMEIEFAMIGAGVTSNSIHEKGDVDPAAWLAFAGACYVFVRGWQNAADEWPHIRAYWVRATVPETVHNTEKPLAVLNPLGGIPDDRNGPNQALTDILPTHRKRKAIRSNTLGARLTFHFNV